MRPFAAVRILRPVIVGVGVAFNLDCAHQWLLARDPAETIKGDLRAKLK